MSALSPNALTTLDVARLEIGHVDPGEEDRVIRYINVASDAFARHTGRMWHCVEGHQERVAGYGTMRLSVSDVRPVHSIDSIHLVRGVEDSPIAPDSYEIEDSGNGWIRSLSGPWLSTADNVSIITTERLAGTEALYYLVKYTGGFVTPSQAATKGIQRTLPFDIEQAAIEYIKMLWATHGRDPTIAQLRVGDGSITYANVRGESVPSYYAGVVSKYRDRVVA